jgi:hypothetical protein
MHRVILLTIGAALGFLPAAGQSPRQAYPAELSMPFGTTVGKLVLSTDYLIFVDGTKLENTFVIPRDRIQDASTSEGVLSVELKEPIRDAGAEQSRLSFRFTNPPDADLIVNWSRRGVSDRVAGPRTSDSAITSADGQLFSYEVKHNHKVGSCSGRLIATGDGVTFESLTDVNDSRKWSMKDIKEVEHPNPYRLEIKPFTGNGYRFDFVGQGMSNADFDRLTKLITDARAGR